MERKILRLGADPEFTSRKSFERRLFSNDKLVMGLSAAVAIGLAWKIYRANHKKLAQSEAATQARAKILTPIMPFEELLRRAEERDQNEISASRSGGSRGKKTEIATKLAIPVLSLAVLLSSAHDSLAQNAFQNEPRVADDDKSKSAENKIQIKPEGAATLETPFIFDFAQAVATPTFESTQAPFTPTMQPTEAARLKVTEVIEASINAELPIKVEMHSCPSGWPLEHGEVSQGPLGATSHHRLYPAERAIDIAADSGSAVFATFDGQVVSVNFDIFNNYGIYVDIQGECNGIPFMARWAHLSAVADDVAIGAEVANRKVIGAVGETGNSDGAHLHYAIFGGLEMANPHVPVTVVSFECDSEGACGVSW